MTANTDNDAGMPTRRINGHRAMFINATLKRSPEVSHTDGLIRLSSQMIRQHGVQVDELRAVDHDIATGV